MNKVPKSSVDFKCVSCNYITKRESQYKRHLMTAKHKYRTNRTDLVPKSSNKFICDCGKEYKARNSLWYHKRSCIIINKQISNDDIMNTNNNNTDIVVQLLKSNAELLKDNAEFKKLLCEQQKQNQDFQNICMDTFKEGKVVNNNNNNNTINNNHNFNLNFFLNTTCKDAMNMSEFIDNMDINFKDIEYIGRNGYVNGMTNMILSRIKELDVTKRPLHCTDLKRETMYIKDNDEWNKDTPDNTQLRNMVKIVAKHNQYQFPLWREKHPASDDMNSATFEFSLKMIQNILGDVGEEQIKLDNKVMRNLSKHILVDKNI